MITRFLQNSCLMMLKIMTILYDSWLKATNAISLINHILRSATSRFSQKGVINVGASDHQLIFCARKIFRIKTGGADKYLNFRSLKIYTIDYYKEDLKQVDFPDYENLALSPFYATDLF